MKVVNVTHELTSIPLGRLGENERTMVIFDVQEWLDEYPGITIGLYNQLPNESTSYPAVITQPTDGKVTWMVGAAELQIVGNGRCELVGTLDDVVVKGAIYKTIVYEALDGEGDTPEPWESWMTEFTRLKGEAETAANTSEAYAIGTRNGTPVESTDPEYHNNSKYYAEQAGSDAADANAAKIAAEAAQGAAETAQGKAEDAQEAAETAQGKAEDAQDAAETAQGKAEDAQEAAENAQGKAEDAQTAAEDAQTAAETAQGKAEDAQTAAETAQGKAEDAQEAAEAAAEEAIESASGKAPVIDDTASGSIATFQDGADGMPMKVIAEINPVQDLHGYDNPWPGGAGKNKVAEIFEDEVRITSNGNLEEDPDSKVICIPGSMFIPVEGLKTYTLSGKNLHKSGNNTNIKVRVALYSSKSILGFSYYNEFDTSDSITLTDSLIPGSGTYYYRISVGADASDVMLENQNGPATDYEPYSNICPISGWTGCNVTRTGKNLLKSELAYTNNSSGITKNDSVFLKAGTYTLAFDSVTNATSWRFFAKCFNEDGTVLYTGTEITSGLPTRDGMNGYLSTANITFKKITITISRDLYIAFVMMYGDLSASSEFSGSRLVVGSKEGVYEAYHGNTYPITFPVSAGTVYGGTLDVTSGVLTAYKGVHICDGTETVVESGTTNGFMSIGSNSNAFMNAFDITSTKRPIPMVSHYKGVQYDSASNINIGEAITFYGSGGKDIGFKTNYDEASEFTAYLVQQYNAGTPVTFVIPLATPIEVQLTGTALATLLGQNNIFCDTGNSAVEYCADTKLYISKQLSASQRLMELIITANHEDSMKATKAYTSGNLLIVNGTLYKATTSIANGATLTVGTNVTATTVAAELAALA